MTYDPTDPARRQPNVSRRAVLGALAGGFVAAPAFLRGRFRLFAESRMEYSARAIKLVGESLTIDMLNQFRFADFAEKPPLSSRWLAKPGTFTAAQFEAYRTSGTKVFALGHGASDYEAGVRYFADWNGFMAGYSDWLVRIDDVTDFERVRAPGKVGVMLTFQTSDHFRTPDDVDTFFGLGQRASQLTYNYANRLGAGFLENQDGGLTVFGAQIVARMNQVGMAVDLSHCADRTTMDGIAASSKPVVFTHASCRALLPDHMRCKTDEAIRALAKSGGVMGIPYLRFMVRDREPVTIEHVLDHFDHVVRLVGVEHAGIGSDMDLIGNPNPVNGAPLTETPNWARYDLHRDPEGRITVAGLDHPKRMFDLTDGLIRRRYQDADIKLILGGNFARVLGTIWPAPAAQ
ncbi:MAG: membrane dipeptidase [Gemmatimonadota bacterium]